MKIGKSLVELATEIERRSNAKQDFVVPAKAVRMIVEPRDRAPAEEEEPRREVRLAFGDRDVGVNHVAHGQIGDYVGIPAKYYNRMASERPHLLAANVNEWLGGMRDNRMMRTLDGSARAWLSDRYRPLENEDLAQAALPVIQDLGLVIMSAEVTETRLYIKAVDERILRDDRATAFERIGGDVMALPANDWKRLAEAA